MRFTAVLITLVAVAAATPVAVPEVAAIDEAGLAEISAACKDYDKWAACVDNGCRWSPGPARPCIAPITCSIIWC
ncbi:hypothetical protein MCOR27_003861 [Pyricularia oryzae]|uniref:Uncharacterized protein n=1 Tax=Pyricularia grisea TaxID=148305 RepID=A0ABQ8NVC2_PYRGI|nr:hypothetical protein MCOR01_005443 [Pyricularia oryzae]KAI6302602.1 hypothetical protein MCOR33_002026 [Pyricularia grisea]KAH9434654.1 hypothetical protein MCOR02_003618 [Pyricularia oryzae]KAI6261811.1 hypothetical protein MCOR19_001894 [Pyricularia oryzae]KAI6268502.1 hypothetical protein MCOR26_009190 [Pyricularia oryzae]